MDEPFFPTSNDAVLANQASLAGWEQSNHVLLRPEALEGALARPQHHWNYTGSLPQAAAALAHGVSQSQAFEDGNKRTAYWLTHHFLHENGLGHLVASDDEELAQHIYGYGEGTHNLDDTARMFEQRQGAHTAGYGDPWHLMGTHECPGCGQGLVDNGHRGYTPVTEGVYGVQGWQCPSCGIDWGSAMTRPRPIQQAYRIQTASWHIAEDEGLEGLTTPQAPQLQNSDLVQLRKPDSAVLVGRSEEHGAGQPIDLRPAGLVGEVLGTDPWTGHVTVLWTGKPFSQNSYFEPWGAKGEHHPDNLIPRPDLRKPGPAIRRRR